MSKINSKGPLVFAVALCGVGAAIWYVVLFVQIPEAARLTVRNRSILLASRLSRISEAVRCYREDESVFPALKLRGGSGEYTVSWRILIANYFWPDLPVKLDSSVSWKIFPNSEWSGKPFDAFCSDMYGRTNKNDTKVFALNSPHSLYGLSVDATEVPGDTVLAIWTDQIGGLNWAAPGDIAVEESEYDDFASLEDLPDSAVVFFVFFDGEVYEAKGKSVVRGLARFSDIDYAKKHKREKFLGELCEKLFPRKS